MFTKLLGFFIGRSVVTYAIAGVIALILAMSLRITYLTSDRDDLEVELASTEVVLQLARATNVNNVINTKALANKLEMCYIDNMVLQMNSQQAVEDFNKSLDIIKEGVEEETLRVRQALQNETCAMVAIPSEAEDVLRASAATRNQVNE